MTNNQLKQYIAELPSEAGIYMFKDENGSDLYIGKAAHLKSRVNSYLKTEDSRIKKMIRDSSSLKFRATASDIEALILESQLIKKFRPPFNIVMRDDKQYFYVGFSKEEFPRIFWTHQPHQDVSGISYMVSSIKKIQNTKYKIRNTEFIGPFTDGNVLKSTLRFLRRVFPYCTCRSKPHNNFCLNYHIGKCLGFCCLKNNGSPEREAVKPAYKNNVDAIKLIMKGKRKSLIKKFEQEMDELAKKGELEGAIELRNKISDLRRIFENAQVIRNSDIMKAHRSGLEYLLKIRQPIVRIEGYDISNIQGIHATGSMVTFVHGQPDKNFYRRFKIYTKDSPNDTAMLKEIIERRFKHDEWPFPDLIVIDGGKGQVNAAVKILGEVGVNIPVIGISKNERHLGHQLIIPKKKEPLTLDKLSPEDRKLLLAIDSEAHRFAINYYRKRHRHSFGIH